MDLKQIANDTTQTLISYLTYRAVRVVYDQLDETDPKRAYWLHQFASSESIKDGDLFIEKLFRERQDLAFRVLTVRESLAVSLADFLPDMLRSGMSEANLRQRSQQLERMTQVSVEGESPEQERPNVQDDH
jgi:RbcX protein